MFNNGEESISNLLSVEFCGHRFCVGLVINSNHMISHYFSPGLSSEVHELFSMQPKTNNMLQCLRNRFFIKKNGAKHKLKQAASVFSQWKILKQRKLVEELFNNKQIHLSVKFKSFLVIYCFLHKIILHNIL